MTELARLAGVSARTLRYYDRIGLLKPARVTASGYRLYGSREVDLLQQILFYRELGVPLDQIKAIVHDPRFDAVEALKGHYRQLLQQRARLDLLIATVAATIAAKEGEIPMSDAEKFVGFKARLIQENEERFGSEARQRFGDAAVNASNAKLMNLSEEEYRRMVALEEQVRSLLRQALAQGDPSSPLARQLAETHKNWLLFFWPNYSEDAHAGLAQMYAADARFKAYYDQVGEGAAEFLRDAILNYLGR